MTTLDGGHWGGSRKRARTSRNDTPSASIANANFSTISPPNSNGSQTSRDMNNTCSSKPCHHETALTAISTELDTMRTLLTCQVCQRLMYEPFALSCGHTFCYSCIDQWMHHKKECPSCRSTITQEPTQSYALRELVLVFAGSDLLLADGETADEHNKLGAEERNVLMKDRENEDEARGGLFKGLFKKGYRLVPIRDHIDGVDRCPECNWEIEDGYCNQCGRPVGEDEFDGVDEDFEEEDEENDTDEEEDEDHDDGNNYPWHDEPIEPIHSFDERDFHQDAHILAQVNERRRRLAAMDRGFHRRHGIDLEEDEEQSSDGDEEYDSEDDGFVVPDDAEPIPLTDDEDTEREDGGFRLANGRPIVIESSEVGSDEEDSDAEPRGTAGALSRRLITHRQRHPIYLSDSDDGEEDDGHHEAHDDRSSTQTADVHGGFSPIQLASDDEQDEDEDDGEDESVTGASMVDFDSNAEPNQYGYDHEDDDDDDDESQDGVGPLETYGGISDDEEDEEDEDEDEDDEL